jgi:hypothetical protein
MHDEPRDTPEVDGDSSDVVTGPIGSANLVEPTKAESLSADLDQLPKVKSDEEANSERSQPSR